MKICVVEDENAVRTSIIHKLNGLQKNLDVYDVQFGFAALERVLLIRPDLVITDIRMPELGGLELLERVRAELPDTRVVLLTGYTDFHYAQKALQLGAMNYLLKPVDKAELARTVEEAEELLNGRLRQSLEALAPQLARLGLPLQPARPAGASLWFDEGRVKLVRFPQGAEPPEGDDGGALVFAFRLGDARGEVRAPQEPAADGFRRPAEFAEALRRVWSRCERERFFAGGVVEEAPDRPTLSAAVRLRRELVEVARALDVPALRRLLPEYLGRLARLPVERLRREAALLMAALDEGLAVREELGFIDEDKLAYWLGWVRQYADWEELRRGLHRFVIGGVEALARLDAAAAAGGPGAASLPDKVMQLTGDPKHRNLTLEGIAQELDIHPVTLSRLFKQQTGENFVHFLIRRKLAYARELLEKTDQKIGDIAEEAGYVDHRYFSHLFKKEYGLTPKEYRRQRSQSEG